MAIINIEILNIGKISDDSISNSIRLINKNQDAFQFSYLENRSVDFLDKSYLNTSFVYDYIKDFVEINKGYHPYIIAITDNTVLSFFVIVSDTIFYELYFPEELKTANKEILKHLGDLKPITDEMSEEEKLAIIQSEFERLYNPNHPVRNNIETLDSIEEVRIIKEALKWEMKN